MKILNVIAQKPHSTGSGIYMTELIRAFDKLNHKQAVIYAQDLQDIDKEKIGSIWKPLHIEEARQYPVYFNSEELPFPIFGMSDVMPYPSLKYSDMTKEQARQYEDAFVTVIERAIDEFKPDVIISHHLYLLTAIIAERFKGIKLWGICHGTDLRQLQTTTNQKERIIDNIKNIDKAFALQEEQAKEIKQIFGLPSEKIKVIGNGFNADIFNIKSSESTEQEEKQKDAEDVIKLVYAGKISKSKGLLSLIGAIDLIDDYELELNLAGGYGDIEEYEEIKNAANKSRHTIHFLGHLNQKELAELFNRSEIFVLPSYYEGLGLVCIEAAACGLPVVVTNTSGIKKFVTDRIDENHFIFIDLPQMHNIDEPVQDELPEFEKKLAEGIVEQIQVIKEERLDKQYLNKNLFSWDAVVNKILE